MDSQQEKPTMETVKEPIRLTDLLKVELCGPVKDQISHIQVCIPNIVEFATCTPACKPDMICEPDLPRCRPDLMCRPDLSCGPIAHFQGECGPSQVTIPNYEEVIKDVKALKEEIAALKKKLG